MTNQIEPSRETTRHRMTLIVYVGWVVCCTVFFWIGVRVGKQSPPPSTDRPTSPAAASGKASGPNAGDAERAAATAAANARYMVQVTVVGTPNEANQIVDDLHRRGFTSAFITLPAGPTSARLYTVKVGFYNLPTANQVAEELQRDLGFRNARVVGG